MSCKPSSKAYEYFVYDKTKEPSGSTQLAIYKYLLKYGPATSKEVANAIYAKQRIARDSARQRVCDLFQSGFIAARIRIITGGVCEWCGKYIAHEPYHLRTQKNYVEKIHSFCSVECREHYENRTIEDGDQP